MQVDNRFSHSWMKSFMPHRTCQMFAALLGLFCLTFTIPAALASLPPNHPTGTVTPVSQVFLISNGAPVNVTQTVITNNNHTYATLNSQLIEIIIRVDEGHVYGVDGTVIGFTSVPIPVHQ